MDIETIEAILKVSRSTDPRYPNQYEQLKAEREERERLVADIVKEHGLLFAVIARDGKVFKIFADGRVDGFGENPEIINRYPTLVNDVKFKTLDDMMKEIQNASITKMPQTQ